jgi:protein CMS1
MSDLQEPLLERLSFTPEQQEAGPTNKHSIKRKRDRDEGHPPKKAAKKTKGNKAKNTKDDDLDVESRINNAFSHMDNQLLADYMAQRTRKYESDLSTIELEDKYLPGGSYIVIIQN